MRRIMLLLCLVFLLTACAENGIESGQSIQNILSDIKNYEDVINETKADESTIIINETNATEEPEEDMTLRIDKKCANSVILYGGCKWKDATESEFVLKIVSASKASIMGVWMRITSETGDVETKKVTGEILPGGRRSYDINYDELRDRMDGKIKIELLPIEIKEDIEYACENQRVYTIPETYCKPSEPLKINEDGTVDESS